jgi:pimeloyl-ACP methyl ester carboxylesterase/DNA-binding CsgD family transcriptional regulator
MSSNNQRIRYLRTPDGVKLAWAEAGSGPVLVKAANWMTHLDFEWESPVWRHWMKFFSENFRYIRHDERGCGMTDWNVGDVSLERWIDDLESVIDASGAKQPLILFGVSQGAAASIGYAIRHPERVSHLIIYGGYARGAFRREDHDRAVMYRAMIDLVRLGWGSDNPTFRQVFTSRFIPKGTDEQLGWFNEICRKTTNAELAARLLETRAHVDISHMLENVSAPTLVMHSRDDDVVPISEGRILASGIPNAEFVELDSCNHVLLEDEPAWERFCDEFLKFTGVRRTVTGEDSAFESLSKREREILSHMTQGLSNAAIGELISISEKTVRNHVTSIFDKLGVWSRAQAIVFARDKGFGESKT